MSNRRLLTALFLPLFVSACSSESGESQTFEEDPALEEAGADAPAQLTLSELIKKTRYGFREEGGAVSAWHATHLVEVFGARVELTPFFPRVPDESGQTPGTPAIPGAALGLETVAVARGDVDLLDAPGAPELEDDGSVTVPRGPIDEHLANTEVGVEQSWTLHQAPGGEGDLEVRIEVDGTQGYVAQTDSGLHFEDPISGLGVSYGVATWIDANGVETTAMPVFEDGQIVIRIPSDVVDASAFPVLLDPVISAENGIDNPVLGGAAGDQIDPSIAVGDNVMMAVWTDYRGGTRPEVRAARVSMNGTVLDPKGIVIDGTMTASSLPDIAWDGRQFVIGYAISDSTGDAIRFARRSEDLNGGAPIVTWDIDQPATKVVVATQGSVTYLAFRDADNVYLARSERAPNGTVSELPPQLIQGGGLTNDDNLDLACEPMAGSCVATFPQGLDEGLGARFYGFSWHASPPTFVVDVPIAPAPSRVASFGNGFVIHYETTVPDEWEQPTLVGVVQELSPSGDLSGVAVGGAGLVDGRSIACSSVACVVATSSSFTAVAPGLGELWTTPIGMSAGGALAHDGSSFVAVEAYEVMDWNPMLPLLPADVFLTRISTEGALSPSRVISTEVTNSETHPDVACSASKCLAVWQDDRGGANAVRGAFTTKAGAPLAAEAFLVGCDPQTGCRSGTRPSVATDGAQFAAAYECSIEDPQSGALHAKACFSSLGLDGTVNFMDAPSWSNGLHRPRVAIGPNGLLFAVTQTGLGFGESDLRGVLVDPNGDTVEVVISAAIDDQVEGAVAFDGSNFVVAWEDWRRGAAFGPDVMAARVSPAGGTVLDPNGIQISVRSSAESRPSVASHGGGNSLIVWEDNRGGSWDIYGARLAGATVADVNGLSFGTPGTSDQKNPSIAFNGTSYQVVWEDDRAGWSELYGRQATTAGAMSGGTFAVATVPGNAGGVYAPALAGDGAGGALVVYERFVAELDQTRVRAKAITP